MWWKYDTIEMLRMKTKPPTPQFYFLDLRGIKHSLFLLILILVSFVPNSKQFVELLIFVCPGSILNMSVYDFILYINFI